MGDFECSSLLTDFITLPGIFRADFYEVDRQVNTSVILPYPVFERHGVLLVKNMKGDFS